MNPKLVLTGLILILSSTYAAFNPADCASMSFWLRMEEETNVTGSILYDACGLNNFVRVDNTTQVPGWDDYGQYFPDYAASSNWIVMPNNASALTTSSRSWRIRGLPYTLNGPALFFDNETAYGSDWTNFGLWDSGGAVYCWCMTGGGPYSVSAAGISTGNWLEMLCSYESVTGNMSLYLNGTLAATGIQSGCNVATPQGGVVIGNYPRDGMFPRNNITFDEAFYRTTYTTPAEAYCLFTMNNLDCYEPQPEPNETENVTFGGCCGASGAFQIPVGEPSLVSCVYTGNETTSYLVNKTYITRSCCLNGTVENCCLCEHSVLESCLYGCDDSLGCKDSAFLPGANNREKSAALSWGLFLLMILSAFLMTSVTSWTQKAFMFLVTIMAAIFVTAIFPFPISLIGVTAIMLSLVYIVALVEGARRNE